MKEKFIVAISCILLPLCMYGSSDDSAGYYFYTNLNKALVHYYIYNRFDSFKHYTDKAFKALPQPMQGDVQTAACVYAANGDYKTALKLFKQAILTGADPRALMCDDDTVVYKKFFVSKEHAELGRVKDSLFRIFKSNLDLEFIQEVFWDLGADQALRGASNTKAGADCFTSAAGFIIDSTNYASLKGYVQQHGLPDFKRIDYVTRNSFQVLFNHYIPSRLDSMNGYYFLNLLQKVLIAGKVPNTFILPALDYRSLQRTGKQLYGTYGYMDSGKYHYNPFLNVDSIDVDRARQLLPPMYLLYKQSPDQMILPGGYKYMIVGTN